MLRWFVASLIGAVFFALSAFASEKYTVSPEEAIKMIGKPNIVFVSGDSEDIFELGHIKGSTVMYAHHLHHTNLDGQLHCSPLFMCPAEAADYIGEHGIGNNTTVIAYDNFRGPNATGVFAYFKSYGHKKVYILDGGRDAIAALDPNQKVYDELKDKLKELKKAKASEDEIAKVQSKMDSVEKKLLVVKGKGKKPKYKKYTITPDDIDLSWLADKDEVAKAANDIVENGEDSKYRIIDTRGMAEIIGERKLDNVARGGHVPGATFMEWTNITDFDKKMSFVSNEQLKEVFKKYGLKKDQTIYAYCHVGTGRSSHIVTALKMLGYDAKVYSGSWDEWGNDLSLPVHR